MKIKHILRLASVAMLLLAAPAIAESITFQETTDDGSGYQARIMHIRGNNTNNEGSINLQVGRTATAGDFFRGLLGYDLSAIPAGSTITSVSLTLTHRADSGASLNQDLGVQLHQLQGTFAEGQAVWTDRAPGVPWTTPGGDFNPTPLSTITDNAKAATVARVFESTPLFVAAAQAALNGTKELNLLVRSNEAENLPAGQRWLTNFVSDDAHTAAVPATLAPLLTIEFISPFGDLQANIDRTTGNISFRNPSAGALNNVIGYSLTSEHGALNDTQWRPIATLNASIDPDGDWTILSDPADATDLSELETSGTSGASIPGGAVINMGNAWIKSTVEDVTLKVLIDDGSPTGKVETYPVNFVPGSGGFTGFEFGDLDFNGVINQQDFLGVFVPSYLTNTSSMSTAEAYQKGDLNDDGVTDMFDFLAFNSLYKAANPGAAALVFPGASVPEPATVMVLMLLGVPAILLVRRRMKLTPVLVRGACLVGCIVMASHASAVSVRNLTTGQLLFYDDFESAPQTTPFEFGEAGNELLDADPVVPAGSPAGSSWFAPYRQIDSDPVPEQEEVIDITQVTTSSSGIDPGPIQGTNYLRTTRTATSGQTFALPVFTEQSTAGDVISMRAMIYTPPGNTSSVGVGAAAWGKDNMGNTVIVISTQYSAGGAVRNSDGTSGTTDTTTVEGLSYVPGEWNFVQYDYHVGENNFDLTVNNKKVTGLPLRNTDQANLMSLTAFGFSGNPPDGTTPRTMYVDAVPELSLTVNTSTGEMRVINEMGEDFQLDSYRITSATSGAFVANALNGFDDKNFDGSGTWTELASTSQHLAEASLGDGGTFANNASLSLGNVYNTTTDADDLVFEYHMVGTIDTLLLPSSRITYITPGGLDGDFNLDGTVDAADYVLWRNNVGQPETVLNGNGNGNGVVDGLDYSLWKSHYGQNGGSLLAPATQVPEPATYALLLTAAGLIYLTSKRSSLMRSAKLVALVGVAATLCASSGDAAVTLDRYYSMGDYSEGGSYEGAGPANGPNGAIVGSSFGGTSDVVDSTEPFVDLDQMGDPVYASLSIAPYTRPGATGYGIRFDGVDAYLFSGTVLNSVNESKSQGMQMWAHVNSAGLGTAQQLVFDTNNAGGPGISAAGNWTQVNSAHASVGDVVPVVTNTWQHVMQHVYLNSDIDAPAVNATTQSPFTSVLYVNGVAVSANNDANIAPSATGFRGGFVVGAANGGTNNSEFVAANFFNGVIDELEVYTSEPNQFDLFTDNDFIATAIAAIPGGTLKLGDVNRDGQITQGSGNPLTDDVEAFVDGWKNVKVLTGAHNSVTIGDWETWGWGDMNIDGQVDLFDAYILHNALQGAGAGGLDFARLTAGAQVPEPATLGIIASAFLMAGLARQRFQRA